MPLLVWQVLGWVLLPAGIAIALWALLRDRSRGRTRCPKCWYDMTGLASTGEGRMCPECGVVVKRDSDLLRTRRHWRGVVAGAALLMAGMVSLSVPGWRYGWVGVLPSSVLVYVAPPRSPSLYAFGAGTSPVAGSRVVVSGMVVTVGARTPAPDLTAGEKLTDEVWRRAGGDLTDWQLRAFARRLLAADGRRFNDIVQWPERWKDGAKVPLRISASSIRSLGLSVKDEGGVVQTATHFPLHARADAQGQFDLEVLLQSGSRTALREVLTAHVGLAPTWDDVVIPVSDAQSNQAAQAALAPRLVMVDGKPTVLVRDRGDNAEWKQANFAMEYTVEVKIGSEVIGRGQGRADWSTVVWKDWEELDIAWSADGQGRLNREAATVTFTGVRLGDASEYFRNPFGKQAKYWTGSFSIPLRPGPHPGRSEEAATATGR